MASVLRFRPVADPRPGTITESPVWDAERLRMLCIEVGAGGARVLELRLDDGAWRITRTWPVPASVSSVNPTSDGGLLLTAGSDVLQITNDGDVVTRFTLTGELASGVFNDAKIDPAGRLVAGYWLSLDGATPGGYARLGTDGSWVPVVRDVGLSNGVAWSPDGSTMYFVDTLNRRVEAVSYDQRTGLASNRRIFASTPAGSGSPDGLTVASDGSVWVAIPYTGSVWRFSSAGEQLEEVTTPCVMPTSCGFGGESGTELFVTTLSVAIPPDLSARLQVDAQRIALAAADTAGGGVYVATSTVPGYINPPFAASS